MKTYLIQRNVPGAGELSAADRKKLSQRSCAVLEQLGAEQIQWIQSFITSDNLWCVYKAESEEVIREHGRRGNFPVNQVLEIKSIISPATAEAAI